jgi:hypothetical protein
MSKDHPGFGFDIPVGERTGVATTTTTPATIATIPTVATTVTTTLIPLTPAPGLLGALPLKQLLG